MPGDREDRIERRIVDFPDGDSLVDLGGEIPVFLLPTEFVGNGITHPEDDIVVDLEMVPPEEIILPEGE